MQFSRLKSEKYDIPSFLVGYWLCQDLIYVVNYAFRYVRGVSFFWAI